jgi:hypothetical protein
VPQPFPPPQPVYTQLKAYLNLSDAQVQSLIDIQNSRNAAQQAIYKQINDKQTQLNTLLKNGTTNALTVGQLEIDINNLLKQLPIPSSSYRASALAVLTPDQKFPGADGQPANDLFARRPNWLPPDQRIPVLEPDGGPRRGCVYGPNLCRPITLLKKRSHCEIMLEHDERYCFAGRFCGAEGFAPSTGREPREGRGQFLSLFEKCDRGGTPAVRGPRRP